MKMRKISWEEYLEFIEKNDRLFIEDQEISLEPIRVERLLPVAEELTDVSTTVWSFPKRGSWATHKGDYRGNWPPQMARALITMYTEPGELVLDQMCGSGTTCIEARLLGRNCIGVDINYNAVILTLHRLYYLEKYAREFSNSTSSILSYFSNYSADELSKTIKNVLSTRSEIYLGDARNLSEIKNESVDLIATHPPYYRIIRYGENFVPGDLSRARNLEEYLKWMREIAEECYRVLKPGKYCAILIGDTRAHKHYVPISHYVLEVFLDAGFILKEEVVKIQHKMKTTREVWSKIKNRDFLLIYHEKLFVFRKPSSEKERDKYRYSSKLLSLENVLSTFKRKRVVQ